MMEVSFDVEKKHLIDFSLYNIKNSKQIQRIVKVQRFLTPLVFLIFALMIGVAQNDIPLWLGVFAGVYIAWVILYPRLYMMSVRRSVKKNIEEHSGKQDLIGNCKLILTEDAVIEESNVRTNKTKWKNLIRLVETKEYVFVFNTETSSYVIPKERFKNEEYEKEYIDMLATKSGKQIEQW